MTPEFRDIITSYQCLAADSARYAMNARLRAIDATNEDDQRGFSAEANRYADDAAYYARSARVDMGMHRWPE